MNFDWKSCLDVFSITLAKLYLTLCLKVIQQIMEKEQKMKSKNVWSFPWNNIRSGACCVMIGDSGKLFPLYVYVSILTVCAQPELRNSLPFVRELNQAIHGAK